MTITPSPAQAAAIRAIVEWYRAGDASPQEFYLAGYAGVGKSTVAALAIAELREKCGVKRVCTGAYTGKAANVLRQKGIPDAQTIHSMVYMAVEDEHGNIKFVLSPLAPAAVADLIALDEVSMVNDEIAADVRSFKKKILVMGDPGQLPPVSGAGAFTNRVPDAFLTEIHRQAAESPIIRLATLARKGEPIPIGDYGDARVMWLTRKTQEEVFRPDAQSICGVHRVRSVITGMFRKRLGFDWPTPLKGERVMCCRNNHTLGIFNGGLGVMAADAVVVDDPIPGILRMHINMDDRPGTIDVRAHPYLLHKHRIGLDANVEKEPPRWLRGTEHFDYGYVLTCHKAQGSEWDHVTVVDDSHSFKEDRQKWLYTAITRASKGVTILRRAA